MYRPEPSRKLLTSENYVETATKPFLTSLNLHCDIEQEFVISDVFVASLRNHKSKYMKCIVFYNDRTNEQRTGYLFEAAEIILMVCRHGSWKFNEVLLQFKFPSKLTSDD